MRKGGSNPTEGVRGCFGREAEARKELGHARQRLFTLTGLWTGDASGEAHGHPPSPGTKTRRLHLGTAARPLPNHWPAPRSPTAKAPMTPMVPVIRRIFLMGPGPFEPKANPGAAISLIDMTTAHPLFSRGFPRTRFSSSRFPAVTSAMPGARKKEAIHQSSQSRTTPPGQHGNMGKGHFFNDPGP